MAATETALLILPLSASRRPNTVRIGAVRWQPPRRLYWFCLCHRPAVPIPSESVLWDGSHRDGSTDSASVTVPPRHPNTVREAADTSRPRARDQRGSHDFVERMIIMMFSVTWLCCKKIYLYTTRSLPITSKANTHCLYSAILPNCLSFIHILTVQLLKF